MGEERKTNFSVCSILPPGTPCQRLSCHILFLPYQVLEGFGELRQVLIWHGTNVFLGLVDVVDCKVEGGQDPVPFFLGRKPTR